MKCTEANAYRMAFPDTWGATITYDEIEGKEDISKDMKILDGFPISGNEKLRKVIDLTPDIKKDNLLINEFTAKIDSSKSKEELEEIRDSIKKSNVSESDKDSLRIVFKERMSIINSNNGE